jgi:hypothetical protein
MDWYPAAEAAAATVSPIRAGSMRRLYVIAEVRGQIAEVKPQRYSIAACPKRFSPLQSDL